MCSAQSQPRLPLRLGVACVWLKDAPLQTLISTLENARGASAINLASGRFFSGLRYLWLTDGDHPKNRSKGALNMVRKLRRPNFGVDTKMTRN